MTQAIRITQFLLVVLGAPLIGGIIARVKARLQQRKGASIWRPYAELLKMFQKEDLVPPSASSLFRLGPVVELTVTIVAAAFIPVLSASALLGHAGDFVVVVYVLAIGRFFSALGAFDGGSPFAGMGASREFMVAALAEGPMLLSLASLAIMAHETTIAGMVNWTVQQNFFDVSAVHTVALCALAIVAIAETGRMPVDNPTSHLELTMIHEAMVLEYSGPSLALVEWAHSIKLHVILALLVGLFVPWGIAPTSAVSVSAVALAFVFYVMKVLGLAIAIALVESSVAKLRMYLVPNLLGVAGGLGVLAVVFTVLMR